MTEGKGGSSSGKSLGVKTPSVSAKTPSQSKTPPVITGGSTSSTPSEMTKALLAGLRINQTPPVVTSAGVVAQTQEMLRSGASADEVSKSLLSLLHANVEKAKHTTATPPGSKQKKSQTNSSSSTPKKTSVSVTPSEQPSGLSMLFEAASRAGVSPAPVVGRSAVSVAELEAAMRAPTTTAAGATTPPVTSAAPTGVVSGAITPLEPSPAAPSVLWTHLRVFNPIPGSTALCGLELRVEPNLGYRVIRVTEKPGQAGNVREGDLIVAIADKELCNLSSEEIRSVFGKNLKDGVQIRLERPASVPANANNPDTAIERKLDFGLMLSGAGVDWHHLAAGKLNEQAKQVSQSFQVEGVLEVRDHDRPLLVLKGPAALVDKAMRQFCVVVVKAALTTP